MASGISGATDLYWTLPLGGGHRFSDGRPFDAGVRFQLGVFGPGFEPGTATPRACLDNWRPMAETVYDVVLGGFSGAVNFGMPDGVFVAGARFYAFGYRQTAPGKSQWVLLTDPEWVLPAPDPSGFPVDVELPGATIAVFGEVDAGSRTVRMAEVPEGNAPGFAMEEWGRQWFQSVERSDPAVGGWLADPDHDGEPNVMEYMTGTSPRDSRRNGNPIGLSRTSGGTPRFVVCQAPSVVGQVWDLELSGDLDQWDPGVPEWLWNGSKQRWEFGIAGFPERGFARIRWNQTGR